MPTVKAGTTFREITREVDGSKILKEYKSSNKVSILVSEVNDFDEWFEKIEPTDSVHWKPKKGELGWIVGYSCRAKKLAVERFVYSHYGETIHFKTAEDAKKSIRENERDWKIYFGIKEEIK
jgi:hypothetical protein